MNTKSFKVTMLLGLSLVNAIFAADPASDRDDLIISSVPYIEEDTEFDLGFDTADYLPEDFNPYKIYVDLDSIEFIEEENVLDIKTQKYLPDDFNAYGYPTDVEAFDYIDAADDIIDFDTKKHLPEGFDPYIRKN